MKAWWLVLLAWPLCTPAHPLAPALLQLRETAPAQYEVLWRTSVSRAEGLEVAPQLPAHCIASEPGPAQIEGSEALQLRWQLDCRPDGLSGKNIAIAGLDRGRINVILRLLPLQGAPMQALLDAEQSRYTLPAPQQAPPVFPGYLRLGLSHLYGGLDHLLFIGGLLLLVRRLRPLMLTVTAFTLAHSLTLALTTFGVIRLPQALAELGIALSLLLLASELARPAAQPASLLRRHPAWMAGGFGLLHGLGFAGALAEIGLPQQEIPLALLAFNLGLEAGQLLLVVFWLAAGFVWRRLLPDARKPVWRLAPLLPAYVIGSLAAYWCCQRAAAMFA